MKIRKDFVTNSSSSSFILSLGKNNPTINKLITEYFKNAKEWYENEAFIIEDEIMLDIYFKEEHSKTQEEINEFKLGHRIEDYWHEDYKIALDALHHKKTVIMLEASYHDEDLRDIIDMLNNDPDLNFAILYESE